MLGQTARNSALLSMAALASRLLGWVRLVVLVAAFGADGRLDPYLAAFKVPDIVYQLIAAGPLSSVLVPLVVRLRNENDEPRARRIMSAVFLVFGLLAIVIAAAALLFAGVLADLGRIDEALMAYSRAIGLNPNFPPNYFNRAGVLVNLVMWAFNLFPLPPLDGGRILMGVLPWRQAQWLSRIEPYGFYVVLALVMLGVVSEWWLKPLMSLTIQSLQWVLWPLIGSFH